MSRPLREIEPTKTSSLKLYSSSAIECLERFEGSNEVSRRISGKSSRCGKYSWLARGSALEVIDPESGRRLSAWRFGWSTSKKLSYVINCVEELSTPDGLYLVVGLQNATGSSGMVCLFDPVLSRVIKAIDFPRAVTTIECITSSSGANAPQHSISVQLHLMFGVIAVGMSCGHVYLVDLRLDDDVEEFDEWNPSHLEIVDADNPDIASVRSRARDDGAHMAFELGDECHMLGSFSYASPEGEILGNYPSSEISVTSLRYIRQLGSLFVGYSFGCFQIWDLEQHSREFSSSFGVYMLPVTHIIYQEPENDPRLCSYLWVARGQTGNEEVGDSPTTITLYQLIYERKEILPGYGRVLKDFSGCGGRFEHQLTGDPYHLADATTCGSRVLCFYTLERDEAAVDVIRMDDSSEEVVSRDLTLVVCVWEAPPVELHSSPSCHMAVFDINRWYHSQMPASIRDAMYGSKDPTCPFFSVYSLTDVMDTANPDALVDVLVPPKEVGRFSTAYGALPEQFYWASSLTFDVICLMETGIVRAKFYGTQQQVLSDLNKKGVAALNEAHEYFHRCWTASLMPKNFDFSRAQEKTFQVEGLLSVALEHNQISFIISCVRKLGEDNVTYAGCNLRVILDWAWDQVIQIKQHLDQLCIPLFDGTGIFVDKQLIAILDHYSVQLRNLVDIFQALSSAAPTTEQGLKELESQHTVCFLLNQYLQVVLFFMKQRLLPELFDNNDDGELSSQYYPGEVLARQYDLRRRELRNLNNDTLGSLMIDRIISTVTENINTNLWDSENRWSEMYPPPNLHALCSLILQEKINPTSKLCIIYYALLDLCSLNPQFRTKKVAEKFASTFGLQPVLVKLFNGFWCLDHKDFTNAYQHLIQSADQLALAPWQNSHIIRLFLEQDESKKALLFIRSVKPAMSRPADVELHLSVLIQNGLVTEAFFFQRQCRDPVRRQELLEHFFLGCHHTKNTNKMLELSFNKVEQGHLIQFLQQSPFPHARELLVMFYLQQCFYVEAIRLNEVLKHAIMSEHDPAAQRRAAVRNVIVKKYFDLLPKVQQDLAMRRETSLTHKATKHVEIPRPKPLSTVVKHQVNPRIMSQTAVINATLEKIAEARTDQPESPQDAPFIGTPSTQKRKPLLSDSHLVSFPKFPNEDITAAATEPKVRPTQPAQQQSMMISPMSTWLRKDRARKVFKGANALSLLQTPPVTKHLSFAATPSVPESSRPTATPHSILKPTKITRRSPSPSIISPSLPPRVRRVSGDHAPWMETGSDNEETGSPFQKKQIRFKSPSPASTSKEESFAFDTRPSPFTKTAIARIPEEDDVMETELEPGVDNSSQSVSGSENETEMQPSTSGEILNGRDETVYENEGAEPGKETDVTVVAMVDLDNGGDSDHEVSRPADAEKTFEIGNVQPDFSQPIFTPEPARNEAAPGGHDVQVIAVLDFDEDDESERNGTDDSDEAAGHDKKEETVDVINEKSENEQVSVPSNDGSSMPPSGEDSSLIRPPIVEPKDFMEVSLKNDEAPSETIPSDQPPSPSKTASPPDEPAASPPAAASSLPPESRFMPLRDTTPAAFRLLTTQAQHPEVSSSANFSTRTSPLGASQSTDLDPNATTSWDYEQESDRQSIPSSSNELFPVFRNSQAETSAQGPEVSDTFSSPVSKAEVPNARVINEGTPMSERGATVSTMTPPMSPPKLKEIIIPLTSSSSKISPRVYLNDIGSPRVDSRTPVVTPSQSDQRRSRSPHRMSLNRSSPPLTRSAQRRRSARLSTPHQSPTDSPISFVTPVRKTSPPRKSSGQKKPLKLATHNMTLRARTCPNKNIRCARLPNTN